MASLNKINVDVVRTRMDEVSEHEIAGESEDYVSSTYDSTSESCVDTSDLSSCEEDNVSDSDDDLGSRSSSSSDISSCSSVSSELRSSEPTPQPTLRFSGLEEFETLLYKGSQVTVLDSYLLLYQYALQHSLTKLAFQELIDLVNVHLPSAEISTLYKLQKFFLQQFQLGKPVSKPGIGESTCPNACDATTSRFVYVPLKQQIKRILERY